MAAPRAAAYSFLRGSRRVAGYAFLGFRVAWAVASPATGGPVVPISALAKVIAPVLTQGQLEHLRGRTCHRPTQGRQVLAPKSFRGFAQDNAVSAVKRRTEQTGAIERVIQDCQVTSVIVCEEPAFYLSVPDWGADHRGCSAPARAPTLVANGATNVVHAALEAAWMKATAFWCLGTIVCLAGAKLHGLAKPPKRYLPTDGTEH